MENGYQKSWKVLENAHKMVPESHGKPLSVFYMHPVKMICDDMSLLLLMLLLMMMMIMTMMMVMCLQLCDSRTVYRGKKSV